MHCPAAIPFSQKFPSTFRNNGIHCPLPPSCNITLPDGAFLKCSYSLTLSVMAAFHRSTPFLARERSLSIELEYRHRTRPSRPRVPEPSLFSTIKMCPEEWLQLPVALTTVANSRPPDVHCDLFVPSVGVFGISETIPFHLQLSGSIRNLRDVLVPSNLEARTPNPTIRVYLLRLITANDMGEKINTILVEGSLRPLSPGVFGLRASTSEDALNWEGQLQLHDITTPTFDVGTLSVMYLIAVELSPPETSSIKRAHYGFPIKVTTDSWVGGAEQPD
ncbi:hypothetical protein B0H13DRAFT_684204 [Mycena leptocephala]|nr:hypothetical protein B0H13DRAFT_684204 [Mycena leptocephala]